MGGKVQAASKVIGLITGAYGLLRGGGVLISAMAQGGERLAAQLAVTSEGLLAVRLSGGAAITLTAAQAEQLVRAGFITVGGVTVFAKAVDPNRLGPAGQNAVPGKQNTTHIPSASGRASYRVPDRLTKLTIGEIKNVLNLEYRSQLRDYLAYAQKTRRTFTIWVRGNAKGAQTVLDDDLLDLVRQKLIRIRAIPGTGTWNTP